MRVKCQGLVTALEVNGNWQEKLKGLSGPYRLSPLAIQRISRYILEHPLEKKSERQPNWQEYAPGSVDELTELVYTNHHWFPVAWLFTRLSLGELDVLAEQVLTHRTLGAFYDRGRDHYRGSHHVSRVNAAVFSGVLPEDYQVIAQPMPDIMLNIFFPRYRYRWE